MTEAMPVHFEAYEDDADLDVEIDADDNPIVTNHDELETVDVVYGMKPSDVEEWDLHVVTPKSPFWEEEFADISLGDEFEL